MGFTKLCWSKNSDWRDLTERAFLREDDDGRVREKLEEEEEPMGLEEREKGKDFGEKIQWLGLQRSEEEEEDRKCDCNIVVDYTLSHSLSLILLLFSFSLSGFPGCFDLESKCV